MELPLLSPIPIKTKHQYLWVRLWRWITSIRKWRVEKDWIFSLPDDQKIVIPAGFEFDGASIPRPLWGILSPVGLLLVPGLVHDFAYRYNYLWAINKNGNIFKYKEGSGRKVWDKLFKDIGLKVNGVALVDTLAWAMLVVFGCFAWKSNRKRNDPEIQPNKTIVIASAKVLNIAQKLQDCAVNLETEVNRLE